MCQGRMPLSVRQRYEKQLADQPDNAQLQEMIATFYQALNHPSADDLADLSQWAEKLTF